jgi:hypothetical protein
VRRRTVGEDGCYFQEGRHFVPRFSQVLFSSCLHLRTPIARYNFQIRKRAFKSLRSLVAFVIWAVIISDDFMNFYCVNFGQLKNVLSSGSNVKP